jgi:hypothetical protein
LWAGSLNSGARTREHLITYQFDSIKNSSATYCQDPEGDPHFLL